MGEDEITISWYETSPRAIIPVELATSSLKISRSLSQVLKKDTFDIRIDTAFGRVIRQCAGRESTWINRLIVNSFEELHNKALHIPLKHGRMASWSVALRSSIPRRIFRGVNVS